jgi:hypothetical protein
MSSKFFEIMLLGFIPSLKSRYIVSILNIYLSMNQNHHTNKESIKHNLLGKIVHLPQNILLAAVLSIVSLHKMAPSADSQHQQNTTVGYF